MPVSKSRKIQILRDSENKLLSKIAWASEHDKELLLQELFNIREKLKQLSV